MVRLMLVLGLCAMVSMVYADAGAPPKSDSSDVSLTIVKWVDVVADDVLGPWSQGHDANGNPNATPPLGNEPTWSGGTLTDLWLGDATRSFAAGAVARADLHVKTNCQWAVQVLVPTLLLNLNSGGDTMPGIAQIGVRGLDGKVRLFSDTDHDGVGATGNTEAAGYYLYGLVGRSGLDDTAGTYTAPCTVQAYSYSSW